MSDTTHHPSTIIEPPGYWSRKYAYVPLDRLHDSMFGRNIADLFQVLPDQQMKGN